MKKRIFSLILTIAMILSMLPMNTFAIEKDETKDQVHVIVENTTLSTDAGAAWDGTLVDTWVNIDAKSTAASCVTAALAESEYEQIGADSGYISTIHNLKAGDGGGVSGWMCILNDWFVDKGLNMFTVGNGTLEANDEIRVVYSLDMGADCGGDWNNNIKTLQSLSFDKGTLAPAFASDTKEYILTVPEDAKSVVVTPTATNKNFQVRTYVGETEYHRSASIPVAEGTVITVKCGDPSWPSMNNGEDGNGGENVPAETYSITITYKDAEEEPKTDPCALTALEVAVGGNTIETATTQALSPAFESAKTEYSTPILDYESNSDNRFVLLKINAPEGATATAKCNDSEVATLVNGEWGVLQKKGGYWFAPTYSGPLSTGKYNEVIITVSAEGEADKVYTVTIPMQPDISKQSLSWKTNLSDAVYFEKDDADAALTVEAQYNNRPLENKEEITYQWYQNTTASTEGGTAIKDATSAIYKPDVTTLGTSYYYVIASCNNLESITSKVITATVSSEPAPKSVSIVCDYPYTTPNDWVKALGGVNYVAKPGDTLQLKAVDENGKETPVAWPNTALGGGTLDKATGTYTVSNTIYSYVQVTSLYDSSIKSEEKAIVVSDYSISEYSKNPSVTLSTDGQKFNKISVASQISGNGYVLWDYSLPEGNIAELLSDLSTKPSGIQFTAMRPGKIEVSFDLDLNGDGKADGNGQTDSTTLTINGIAVEDSDGKLTKTYLEISKDEPNPTMQLKALSSTENAAFTWTSADESVAIVDENGKVTAKAVGSTIISAADGTYTGGIKVVVTDADVPYFEQIDFTTTSAWSNGLSNASWKTADFKPATLEYKGLALTKAAASTLTFNNTTLYNTEKYTATATYTDANGEKQTVNVESGKTTALANIPFETSVITITLADKTDAAKKTDYTFEITRPRDTTKTIDNNGIVFTPDGRYLIKDTYNEKIEGTMYEANADGSFAQYKGVSATRYYYRTYALNALDSFTLNLKASTAFTHIRYSTDDGSTWKYLGQSGSDGLKSDSITFPSKPEDGTNPVAKVIIQLLDDATYTANVNAGKDGFADTEPTVYTVWVEQIPVLDAECDILTAEAENADWYPTFAKNRLSYRLVTEIGAEAPVLTYTVSDNAVVKIGDVVQTPDADGKYTLTLTNASQSIVIASGDGSTSKTYSFGYSERESNLVPDKVVDFLSINSQYTNGNGGGFGVEPQKTITGGDVLSLGNFGGYVTYYYENALTDHPNHTYGVDFYISGNAFKDISTGTGLGSMEPGQVWVSEDGSTWYALAGSEHYEDGTIWDYTVTYSKTDLGKTAWSDNKGNTDATTHGRSFDWPKADIYTMNDLPTKASFTISSVLIPCADGTITGTDNFNSFSKGGRFGYVDLLPNGTNNPYLKNTDYTNASSGFDLAWAVDANGLPVDVSDKEFHYVKVVTASNIMAGSANEKSTEVGSVERATEKDAAVGVTAAPTGVTISGGSKDVDVTFAKDTYVYSASVSGANYVSIKVNGTAEGDNIYVNNQRVESGSAAEGIKITGEKLVRIIVQNGEKEPVLYLLKLTSDSSAENVLIDGIKVDVYGIDNVAETKDGKNYTLTVDHRIDKVGLKPALAEGATLLVNGKELAKEYALNEGENTFTLKASKGDITQDVTLTITREKAPVSDKNIKVYFELLGDDKHGTPTNTTGTHTLVGNNLKTWIAKKEYTVPDTATVLDVLVKALDEAGLDYVNSGGNYISEINGLEEFSNGKNSGWMYTVNGKHPGVGISAMSVKDGDHIIFHYTDDYTIEEGSPNYTGISFVDVDKDDWFYHEVVWAVEKGITNGTSPTTFSPEDVCKRSQMVTFLWRAAGSPAPVKTTHSFNDVNTTDYYNTALLWAIENGITKGTSETTFSPDEPCTRGQMVTFLYRYAKSPAVSGNHPFKDVPSTAYYYNAVVWASEEGITKGTSATAFSPDEPCTRSQMVTFLYRYLGE